jgi:hypothetical protein
LGRGKEWKVKKRGEKGSFDGVNGVVLEIEKRERRLIGFNEEGGGGRGEEDREGRAGWKQEDKAVCIVLSKLFI